MGVNQCSVRMFCDYGLFENILPVGGKNAAIVLVFGNVDTNANHRALLLSKKNLTLCEDTTNLFAVVTSLMIIRLSGN